MKALIKENKKRWQQIPKGIRNMIVNGALFLLVWKILYTFWLEPRRILDRPLTYMVAAQTTEIMQIIWPESNYGFKKVEKQHKEDAQTIIEHVSILKDNKRTITIADNCNGLEIMVLYAAFIICLPGRLKRKISFIIMGIPILHTANLFRCIGLVWLHLYWPGAFDFAHHYLFKIIVYGISFGLWVLYLGNLSEKKQS